jgi:ElaB/YqjD/DUF883 family membrane-anchored ribosome-binding protein
MKSQFTEDRDRFSEEASSTAMKVKDNVTEKAGKAKEKVAEVARKAADKLDEQRDPAADKLESAASTLHEKADGLPGGEKVANMAHATADKMQATAGYVREHDVSAMMDDVEGLVRRHPGQSLLAAAAVGFLVGRLFRSDD